MTTEKRSEPDFTPEARAFWSRIKPKDQELILGNVFCGKCLNVVRMNPAEGRMKNGMLILKGTCATCGHKVARAVEQPPC